MKRIVWLASWYPTGLNTLTGDFIRRHAQACSLFQPVDVIHVKKYPPGINKKKTITTNTDPAFPALRETICYYSVINLGGLERIYSYVYSLLLYHRLLQKYSKQHGKPHLLHVHVMLRCGLVALYNKWMHKIPYVVTEHYGGYMPEAQGFIKGITAFNYLPLKLIAVNATAFAPVSQSLAQALQKKLTIKNTLVIPNTVDTGIFFPGPGISKHVPTTFLHVSTLTPQKNPVQMLAAFALLKRQYHCPFELWIVGPKRFELEQHASELQIMGEIKWFEETTQQNIAELMGQANALVLYSRFESFGCVNIEAMACGLPVIVSDLPVFKEYLQEGATARFAAGNNPSALAEVLYTFICEISGIEATLISRHAQPFNYSAIGSLFGKLYTRVIGN